MFFSGKNKHYHHIPGRIRIFVPEIYRSKTLSDSLEEYLASIPNLTAVHCNSFTGRALITYNEKKTTLEQILRDINIFQRKQNKARCPVRKEKVDEPEDLPLGLQGYRLAGLVLVVLGIMVNRLLRRGSKVSPP